MADSYYDSPLTGAELDEAFRKMNTIDRLAAETEQAAGTAKTYGTIVQNNQQAIRAIQDNLGTIQQAPQAADTAVENAARAEESARAAAESAAQIDPANYYRKAEVDARVPWMYTARLLLDGWQSADESARAKGYNFTQTAALTPDDPAAPAVTAASVFVTAGTFLPTGVAETDATLSAALSLVNSGCTDSGANTVTTLVAEKPQSDLSVRWAIQTEVV